jgi:hypothetical protein
MRRRPIFWLAVLPLVAGVRASRLGRPRPGLLGHTDWRPTAVHSPEETVRVWITDGSLPVFSDTTQLQTSHPVLAGLKTRYEGFIDPGVARGSLEVARADATDVLFVEAEWCVEFPEGLPRVATADTPIVLQGLIEGKWMNRLLATRAWQPASIGNNVLAAGRGIRTTLGALEDDLGGEALVVYESTSGGRREHVTRTVDLVGHNLRALVEEVLALGEPLDAINLGALGLQAAVVNEKSRVLWAALPLPLPHRAKERLVWRALADGLGLRAGDSARLTVTDGAGSVVGDATLRLAV